MRYEWEIRVGIDTGKIVGGIIGSKKYIYDIFGNPINTASRLETNSEIMRINLSERTYKFFNRKARNELSQRTQRLLTRPKKSLQLNI